MSCTHTADVGLICDNTSGSSTLEADIDEICFLLRKSNHGLVTGLELRHISNMQWLLICQDASNQGSFRYQLFNKRGFLNHRSFDTEDLALRIAVTLGYVIAEPGILDKLSNTECWRQGMREELRLDVEFASNS